MEPLTSYMTNVSSKGWQYKPTKAVNPATQVEVHVKVVTRAMAPADRNTRITILSKGMQ